MGFVVSSGDLQQACRSRKREAGSRRRISGLLGEKGLLGNL